MICATYYPGFMELPVYPKSMKAIHLVDLTWQNPCKTLRVINLDGKLALVNPYENCSCGVVAQNLKNANALGVIIYAHSNTKMFARLHEQCSATTAPKGSILVLVMETRSLTVLQELENAERDIYLDIYTAKRHADPALLLLAAVALLTVVVGADISGKMQHQRLLESERREHDRHPISIDEAVERYKDDNMCSVVAFVTAVSLLLAAIVIFFDVARKALIPSFAVSAAFSIAALLEPLLLKLPVGTNKIPPSWLFEGLQLRQALLLLPSITFAGSWVVLRHNKISWVLQNVLGAASCMDAMTILPVKSLRTVLTMMASFVLTDIILAYLASIISQDGMALIDAVIGTPTAETLPVAFRVPLFTDDPLTPCFPQEMLLGYGDVAVVGMFISFCRMWDLANEGRSHYFGNAVLFFTTGLGMTFISTLWLEFQVTYAAMVCLIPATLAPTLVVAYWRGHLFQMWNGTKSVVPEGLTPRDGGDKGEDIDVKIIRIGEGEDEDSAEEVEMAVEDEKEESEEEEGSDEDEEEESEQEDAHIDEEETGVDEGEGKDDKDEVEEVYKEE